MSRRRDSFSLTGEDGPISIERDEHGIPHVQASSEADALRGQGFCHAIDRGLQMLFLRILARGELSRHLDSSDRALAIDTFFRKLDLTVDIADEYKKLTPHDRRAVEAYCDGANRGFDEAGTPWELKLLGYHRGDDAWTWADLVLIAKIMGYVGLGASQGEVEHWLVECVQAGVDRALLEELFPGKLGDLDEELIRQVKIGGRLMPREIWSLAAVPKAMASNNWAIAGEKTASGFPLLCNDPHLEVNRLPAVFYETVLRWPGSEKGDDRYLLGVSVPGTPGVVSGRNRDLSWSVTYAYMDAIDSWVEDCRDRKYRRNDDWIPFDVRRETIERKNKPAVTLTFYQTKEHGTLEGDPNEPGLYLATRWSNRDGTAAGAVGALVELLDCETVETGSASLARFSNSAWCMVLADRHGSIGYQMSGQMPIRREGAHGLVPLPGWDPTNDWKGYAAPEDLPRAYNPASGVIVTANNDLNHLGRLKPITLTLVPYRAERIQEVLDGPGPFTVADMKALQYDLTSTQARRFLPFLQGPLATFSDRPNARLLAEWDGVYRPDSKAATLFERFYRSLAEEVFTSALGNIGTRVVAHMVEKTALINEYYALFDRVLLAESSRWFGGRSRAEVYLAAIERSDLLNIEPEPWSQLERVKVRHILLGDKLPLWMGFDRGPISLPGARATVMQGQVNNALGYPSATGPSVHLISDMGTDEIHSNLPGGPSDRRFSPWYASDYKNWLKGVYKTLRGTGSDRPRTSAFQRPRPDAE